MKVINDLVVVEVPNGHNNWYVDNGILSQKERHPENSYTLPFPCTIIGLATKIDLEQTRYVLRESGAKLWSVGTAKRIMYKVLADQHGVDVSFTHDLLFLKRI